MAEEIGVRYELHRDWLKRGSLNQEIIAEIILQTSDDFTNHHPQTYCDVILLVDTSGSMNQAVSPDSSVTKRNMVMQAIERIASQLDPQDTLSLVCYDTNAYTELNRKPGSESALIAAAIPKIANHSGMTNFEAAFKTALSLVKQCTNGSRKVIFLTDGHNTTGSIKKARQYNQEIANLGCVVDCMGVGSDFNFKDMQTYTSVSGGRTEMLTDPNQAADLFTDLLGSAQRSLISNAVLQLSLPTGSRDVEIFQYSPEVRYYDNVKIERDGSVYHRINIHSFDNQAAYAYVVHARCDMPSGTDDTTALFAKSRLDYDIPVLNLKGEHIETDVVVNLADDDVSEMRDSQIESDYVECSLELLDREFNIAANKKDWNEAGKLLEQMAAKAHHIRLTDKERAYRDRLQKLVDNGHLTQDDLNTISNRTSKSSRQLRQDAGAENVIY
ncbi:vWA domain-containing protein [Desulfobacter latus]|uniref:VWA domain-containing protein n=1 Tax=Desulfobacter latus TaxID=2292 RepID=A0A850SR20_9BACT|nr:VWA domain-containing protein [Desulfobacter latus]NWH03884.1 VWA domain-containing protein [Desulfobacter latus]